MKSGCPPCQLCSGTRHICERHDHAKPSDIPLSLSCHAYRAVSSVNTGHFGNGARVSSQEGVFLPLSEVFRSATCNVSPVPALFLPWMGGGEGGDSPVPTCAPGAGTRQVVTQVHVVELNPVGLVVPYRPCCTFTSGKQPDQVTAAVERAGTHKRSWLTRICLWRGECPQGIRIPYSWHSRLNRSMLPSQS